MERPSTIADQAAILGAIIVTFFALDANAGAWGATDAFVGMAAGLILLGFARLPETPWRSLASAAQMPAIAAVGAFCLFLILSPWAQHLAGGCPPDAEFCDPGDPVSERFLPVWVPVLVLLLVEVLVLYRGGFRACFLRKPPSDG